MSFLRCASLALPLALLAAGCDDKKSGGGAVPTSTPPTASTAAPLPSAPASAGVSADPGAPVPEAQVHFRAGPAATFLDLAQSLDIDDAHKATIEKLSDQLDVDEDGAPVADIKALHDDIVAALRAGAVDATKLQPRVVLLQKTMQTRLDKETVVMNALFAALAPESRKALTAQVRTKQAEREADMVREAGDAGVESLADRSRRRPDRLKKELDLDAAQRAAVDPILAKMPPESDPRGEARKRLETLLTAFEGDKFDAKKLDAFGSVAAKARIPIDREIQFLALLVPILKPEQRDALAGKLEGERLRVGTGAPVTGPRDWPFPFELEPGDVVSGLGGTKPKRPKGMPSSIPAPSSAPPRPAH